MAFTLDQVRGFVAVAEEGNFGRAAERLRMTQPPLSRQIQRLERSIGVRLFVRTQRAAVLTPAGSAFLEEARQLLTQASAAPLAAQRAAEGTAGTVRIGFTMLSALSMIGAVMTIARKQLPDVDLQLHELITNAQIAALEGNRLDLGFVRGAPRSDQLDSKMIFAEPLILAAPKDHRLITQAQLPTLHDIATDPIVMHSPTEAQYLHGLVVAEFHRIGAAPRYLHYTSQTHTILALVDAEIGVALVPRTASTLQLRNVAYREVADLGPRLSKLYAAWHGGNDNPALHRLLGALPEDLSNQD